MPRPSHKRKKQDTEDQSQPIVTGGTDEDSKEQAEVAAEQPKDESGETGDAGEAGTPAAVEELPGVDVHEVLTENATLKEQAAQMAERIARLEAAATAQAQPEPAKPLTGRDKQLADLQFRGGLYPDRDRTPEAVAELEGIPIDESLERTQWQVMTPGRGARLDQVITIDGGTPATEHPVTHRQIPGLPAVKIRFKGGIYTTPDYQELVKRYYPLFTRQGMARDEAMERAQRKSASEIRQIKAALATCRFARTGAIKDVQSVARERLDAAKRDVAALEEQLGASETAEDAVDVVNALPDLKNAPRQAPVGTPQGGVPIVAGVQRP